MLLSKVITKVISGGMTRIALPANRNH